MKNPRIPYEKHVHVHLDVYHVPTLAFPQVKVKRPPAYMAFVRIHIGRHLRIRLNHLSYTVGASLTPHLDRWDGT